jgi:hypothetical protein
MIIIPIVYWEPCDKFKKDVLTAIKKRKTKRLWDVLCHAKASYGDEKFCNYMMNFIIKDSPFRWKEVTKADLDYLEEVLKAIGETKGIFDPIEFNQKRKKAKGFKTR